METKAELEEATAPAMHSSDLGRNDTVAEHQHLGLQAASRLYDDSAHRVSDGQLEAPTSEKARNDWALEHQVQVRVGTNNDLVYSIAVNNKDVTLFSTKDSAEGLHLADKKIEHLTDEYRRELTHKYKVRFSHEGEDVEGQLSFDAQGKVRHGEMVHARAPRLLELANLKGALERGRPSQLLPNDNHQGLKFYFLKTPLRKDADDAAATHVAHDKDGKAAIYVGPDGLGENLVVKDGKQSFAGSIDEHVVLHELAHNSQARLGWLREKQFLTYSRALGFDPFVSPAGETIFALRSKSGDLYRVEPDSLDWLSINDKGQYLDKNGQVSDLQNAARLDPGKMREAALVRPATFYFSNPLEMAAESLALFKEGKGERRKLLQESPELYRFTKDQDQKDINQSYGKNADGKPLYLRLPDGRLTLNNIQAEKLIADFEKAAMIHLSKQ
ncbi:MAG: hypothetical protein JSS86_09360 [Cyanobacteria bacterium SZAS LIN-2]|nr:hypothetical protein [Cyanobacteria bacterium SZAS LIN-2]